MIQQKPFISKKLEEERTDDIVNVRLNPKDREILNKFKLLISQKKDSTALKVALFYSSNVLHCDFSGDIKVKLSKRRTQYQEDLEEN